MVEENCVGKHYWEVIRLYFSKMPFLRVLFGGPEFQPFIGNFYSWILHDLLEHMAETVLNLDCNIILLIYFIKVYNCTINNQKKWIFSSSLKF